MTALFESVLRISAEAAVLALLVLGARLIIGRKPGLMLTVLYLLIAVRLIVPIAVSSPFSVHNIWNEQQTQLTAAINNGDATTAPKKHDPIIIYKSNTEKTMIIPSNYNNLAVTAEPSATAAPLTPLEILALIWVGGMIVFAGVILTGNALFIRRIRRNRDYGAPAFIGLLDECKQTLGIKRHIRAICASETGTAAVYGIFRPVLLISPASFETLTEAQKRHVLLHELSHIRRRDTLVCAGATVLNIVHWFNPFVWIVFAQMRRDIEVQCDAHVFRGLQDTERTDYAGTLLKLAGPVQAPKFVPALFISRSNIKRRIVMIMKHRKKSALFTIATLLLTMFVAVTGCTTAAPTAKTSDEPKPITTFTLDLSGYDSADDLGNEQKAADLINGTVIKPGETISLNDIMGPQDTASMKAAQSNEEKNTPNVISTVMYTSSDRVAVATALYNAAIRAELDIVEYEHGSMPVNLALAGLDAMVGTPGPDLKISNPYDSDVTIEAKLDDTILSVSIYGPTMAYTVDFYSEKVKNESNIPNTNEDNNTQTVYFYSTDSDILPNGAKIESANTYEFSVGTPEATYNVYKVYYDADGNKIKQELYETSECNTMGSTVIVNEPNETTAPAASGTPQPTPEPTPMP